jgi:predicted nicotinamide N-methyase
VTGDPEPGQLWSDLAQSSTSCGAKYGKDVGGRAGSGHDTGDDVRVSDVAASRPHPADTFIRANTVLTTATHVPEIRLHLATEITPIWQATETWLAEHDVEPPFWAFAWPGGQALARHILDNPALVAGKRVLDFAAGGGIAAIACAIAGALSVEASEIDGLALAAVGLNAAANGVDVTQAWDVVGVPCRWDLILCGDVCYEAPMTGHIMPWLSGMAHAAEVWIADPGRAYLPASGLAWLATYQIETTLELEDRVSREVGLYRLTGGRAPGAPPPWAG